MSEHAEWSPLKEYAGRKTARYGSWQDILAISIILVFSFWIYRQAATLPQYEWNWRLLLEFAMRKGADGNPRPGLLILGFLATLRIGFWTLLFSLAPGIILGALCAQRNLLIRIPCHAFINIVRNTPPLVILFCVYFFAGNILPVSALEDLVRQLPEALGNIVAIIFAGPGQMDRMIAAILALGVYQGAYVAEIARAGIESVNRGQWDAARALGFSRGQCLRLVIIPQAARFMIPPMTGQAITTFKDSALASLISLPELTFQSLEIMSISRMTFEIWVSSAILYLVIGAVCALAGRWLEKKYSAFT